MPRRLVATSALLLVAILGAGCSDGGEPAARVGDSIVITNEELIDEVAEWASSPALLQQVGLESAEGAAPGSYASNLVAPVLSNRIRFDLHREQFDALGLSVDEAQTAQLEEQLAPVLDELGDAFGERLVADLVRVNAVATAMGQEYAAWVEEVGGDVEVSSRYGTWDRASAVVVPPAGPRPAPSQVLEL